MAKGQKTSSRRGKRSTNLLNYPRAGKTGWTRFLPSLRLIAVTGLTVIIAGCVAFAVGYAMTDIPEPNLEATGQTSTVYYQDGKTPIGHFKIEDRKSVTNDEISEDMKNAAVAAEDTSFYENRGISIKGLSRAVVGVVTNNYAGGGSTITQQYVKNFYLTNEHSLNRKVKEMFIAIKIDQQQSKDEILADYLNTIYLGRHSYGIEVASQNYFDKPATDLDLSESALMAAMIQRPGAGDPAEDPALYEARFHYVLNSMADQGYITQEQADTTKLPEVTKAKRQDSLSGQTGYMMDYVRREAKAKLKIDDQQLDRGGYNIVTTFDKGRMKDAENAIENLPADQPAGLKAGLVSIDPTTGGIEAFYGGKNYLDQAFNNSTQGHAQAGSTFKPFALVAGLENGVRLTDRYAGSPTTMRLPGGGTWTPQNFGNASYGPVTLLKATQSSINTAYAQLNIQVGPDKTVDVAQRAGLSPNCTDEQMKSGNVNSCTIDLTPNAANVLGTPSVKVIDMATAYSTFAANGVHRDTHSIQTISAIEGDKQLYKADTKGKRVFDEAVAAETSYALRQVVNGGSGSYAQNLGRPAAGKTGTSSSNLSAWFSGYTPNLETSVVLYRNDPKTNAAIPIGPYGGRSEVTGGSFPIQVWTDYMKSALEGVPVVDFPERGQLPQVKKPVNTGEPAAPRPKPTQKAPVETKAPEPTEEPTESPEPTKAPEPTKPPEPTRPPNENANDSGSARADGTSTGGNATSNPDGTANNEGSGSSKNGGSIGNKDTVGVGGTSDAAGNGSNG